MQSAIPFFFFLLTRQDLFTYHFPGSMAHGDHFLCVQRHTGSTFNDLLRLEHSERKLFSSWASCILSGPH